MYVPMFTGNSTSILRYGGPNSDMTFLEPHFSLKNARPPFFYTEGLFLEIKISFFCHIVEALSHSLNHNSTLINKQNSVQDLKKAQNSFVPLPELKVKNA